MKITLENVQNGRRTPGKIATAQFLIRIAVKTLPDQKAQRGDEHHGQEQQQHAGDRPTADGLAEFLDDDPGSIPIRASQEMGFKAGKLWRSWLGNFREHRTFNIQCPTFNDGSWNAPAGFEVRR
ncbi:MAG: hypothetical protein WDM80_17690 [Limisphaerales bacterium]